MNYADKLALIDLVLYKSIPLAIGMFIFAPFTRTLPEILEKEYDHAEICNRERNTWGGKLIA